MGVLLTLLSIAIGLGSLVCFIMVLIKMFQHGEQTMGIVCIVLLFCGGIGALVALVLGWVNADKWNVRNIVMIWTALVIAGIIVQVAMFAMGFALMPVGNPAL